MTGRRMVRWLRLLAVSAAVVWLGVWSGAGNILDSRAQESGVYHKSQTYDKDQNRKNARRLFDGAGLMTSEEAGALEERIAQCRKKTGMDVAGVTAYNDGSDPHNMQMIFTTRTAWAQAGKPAAYCF